MPPENEPPVRLRQVPLVTAEQKKLFKPAPSVGQFAPNTPGSLKRALWSAVQLTTVPFTQPFSRRKNLFALSAVLTASPLDGLAPAPKLPKGQMLFWNVQPMSWPAASAPKARA